MTDRRHMAEFIERWVREVSESGDEYDTETMAIVYYMILGSNHRS